MFLSLVNSLYTNIDNIDNKENSGDTQLETPEMLFMKTITESLRDHK
jgi:hypothetical protein